MLIYIILGVLIVAIILMFAMSRRSLKKNKDKFQKIKDNKIQLENTLNQTKQHLKYKNRVAVISCLSVASATLFMLIIAFILFLPIFQIKYELLGINLYTNNFSFLDNCLDLINEDNSALNFYTDVGSNFYINIFFFLLPAIWRLVSCRSDDFKKTFDTEVRTVRTFTEIKVDTKKSKDWLFELFFIYIFLILILSMLIIMCKYRKPEFGFLSDTTYTTEIIGRYIYYSENGKLVARVYQNNFKYFNGFSAYFAIPVVCFAVDVLLNIIKYVLNNKLKKEILKEEIIQVENTAENSAQ